MVEHVLKCWNQHFDAVACGDKSFEVRYDDRGFQKGDVLVLQRASPEPPHSLDQPKRELRRRVSYVLPGGLHGVKPGYVVMALAPENTDGK